MSALASKFNIERFQFSDKRKDLVKMARVAETAERYEDMCQFMRALVKECDKKTDLTVEERNLLSVAYKNVIGARRASWRTLNVDDHKDDSAIKSYKDMVVSELEEICKDILDLLENSLIVGAKDNEPKVFYYKMTGDYYRYLAELQQDPKSSQPGQKARENYERAVTIADEHLSPTHPIRLGLALNFSVCYFEILKDSKKACELAKKAFDDAISKLDQLDEASYKDSTLIMQLLRDNLTLWTSENNEEAEAQNEEED